jgi:hypothetical protein
MTNRPVIPGELAQRARPGTYRDMSQWVPALRAALAALGRDDRFGEGETPYSTVTLLARLRGWSTSVPLAMAA